MPFDPKRIPTDLIDNLKKGNSALYVGSGLSIKAGLPSWATLMTELIEEVKKLPYDMTAQISDYEIMKKDPNKFLSLAQDLKSALGDKMYNEYLEKRFGNDSLSPTEDHKTITNIPFAFIITTNYDQLIEKAFAFNKHHYPAVLTHISSRDIAYKLWNNQFFILKAHGDVVIRKDEIIMTERDYREILFKSQGFQTVLQVMFSTKSIVFVGTSFTDPDFILLMRYLHTAYDGGGPTHYILINENEVLDVEAKRNMEDFNLHSIKYNPENDREQVGQFLTALKDSVSVV